nr:zinc finger BED domain-containing protein RICESLEEPER 2-like [Ipomoea batatas]
MWSSSHWFTVDRVGDCGSGRRAEAQQSMELRSLVHGERRRMSGSLVHFGWRWRDGLCKITSPSVNYSGSATGINVEYDFDSKMPSPEQLEPKSPSIEEVEQPNSEEPKPKRAKSTTSDVWKSFTKIGMVDGKEKAKCNGCGKEYIVGGIRYGTSSLLRHIPKCVALPKYHNVGTMMLDAQGKLRSSYPTSNLYFMQIWTIENLLREHENSDDLILQEMSLRMRMKFDKYWSEYCVILAIAIVLDPRLKFDMMKYCYRKFDHIGWENKLDVVKRKMYVLFSQYENGTSLASTSTSTSSSSHVQAHSSHAPQLNYFGVSVLT